MTNDPGTALLRAMHATRVAISARASVYDAWRDACVRSATAAPWAERAADAEEARLAAKLARADEGIARATLAEAAARAALRTLALALALALASCAGAPWSGDVGSDDCPVYVTVTRDGPTYVTRFHGTGQIVRTAEFPFGNTRE